MAGAGRGGGVSLPPLELPGAADDGDTLDFVDLSRLRQVLQDQRSDRVTSRLHPPTPPGNGQHSPATLARTQTTTTATGSSPSPSPHALKPGKSEGAETRASLETSGHRFRDILKDRALAEELDAQKRAWEVRAEPPPYFIYPTSKFRRYWDMWILLLLLYISTVMVFRLSFDGIPGIKSFYFWWNRIMDVCFLVDVGLNFITGYVDREGHLETNIRTISRRYLRSWFVIDAISTFPWDLVILIAEDALVTGRSSTWVELPRLLKLFRILRVFQFSRNILLQEWFTKIEVQFNLKYGHLRLYMFVVVAAFIAHWTACLFYFFAVIQDPGTSTWITEYGLAENKYEFYVGALYFSVYTITTIGYGDVTPVSTAERVYTVFLMMLGAAIWAWLLSAVAGLLNELAINEIYYRTMMDQLAEYAKQKGLPEDLTTSIRRYLHHRREHHRFVNERDLMEAMSGEQRAKLMKHTYLSHIEKSYLLSGIPDQAVTYACASMTRFSFAPGEHVFRAGRAPQGMYVVTLGNANLTTKRGDLLRRLSAGDIFGEEDLFFDRKRRVNCVAERFLDVAMLSRDDVLDLLESCPEKFIEVRHKESLRSWSQVIEFAEEQARTNKVADSLAKAAGLVLTARSTRRRMDSSSAKDLTLHCAKGDLESVVWDLEHGADAAQADYDHRTPLHLAASEGHTEVVKVLLKHGADPHARDRWGNTPADDARRDGHRAVLDILGEHPVINGAVPPTVLSPGGGNDDAQSTSTLDRHDGEEVGHLRRELRRRERHVEKLEDELDVIRGQVSALFASFERLSAVRSGRSAAPSVGILGLRSPPPGVPSAGLRSPPGLLSPTSRGARAGVSLDVLPLPPPSPGARSLRRGM